ncbi:hypothetical protein RUR49_19255 [Pseudoxanthobacter sp. M-2]|uniref:hypothetical protein n=1 Tax=Pseudoxanthobacter sp. M-2 TaxID=3078754 RepID=UPI0038FC789B
MSDLDRKELETALYDFVSVTKQAIREAVGPLADRIEMLERRATKGMMFVGTYSRAADYARGSVVVVDGQSWCAIREVMAGEAPAASDAWSLMARKGKDGKDAGR